MGSLVKRLVRRTLDAVRGVPTRVVATARAFAEGLGHASDLAASPGSARRDVAALIAATLLPGEKVLLEAVVQHAMPPKFFGPPPNYDVLHGSVAHRLGGAKGIAGAPRSLADGLGSIMPIWIVVTTSRVLIGRRPIDKKASVIALPRADVESRLRRGLPLGMRSVLVLKLRNTIPSQLKITNAIGTVSLADLDRVLRDPVANDADRADEST